MHDLRAWLWRYRDDLAAGLTPTPEDVATHTELSRLYDEKLDTVRRLHDAGVRLMAGSDSAWGYYRAGNSWLEMHALTDAGLSTTEALVAGTSGAAEAIAVGETVGRLAPGRDADILVVPGDPVADLDVLGRPLDVFLAGRRVRRLAAE